MKTRLLGDVGIEISDCSIDSFTKDDYREVKRLYYKHNVVVLRQPCTDTLAFAKVCGFIGPICNEQIDPFKYDGPADAVPVQRVSGMRFEQGPPGIFGAGKLDWHCNVNGPTRAPGVGLIAVTGVEGSITSWMSTIPAYASMPQELKDRIHNLTGHYHYNPDSWAPGAEEWQLEGMRKVARDDGPYQMPLLQKTPAGETGLYFHFLNDLKFPDDPQIYPILKDYLFQERFIYHHHWEPGDIVLSNQLVTLHKRQTDEVSKRLLLRYTFRHHN